jgi:hypothetical protein
MSSSVFKLVGCSSILCIGLGLLLSFASLDAPASRAADAAAEAAPEPAPPAGQEYTGAKRCASCHFDEYMKWSKSGHSKALQLLPANFQKDPKCLKCHTTGYGEPTGFQSMPNSAALAGVGCEICHGPGSIHEEVSKPFAQVKNLTPDQEKTLRDSIWKMTPKNVCVECHQVQAHKESATPAELRKKK